MTNLEIRKTVEHLRKTAETFIKSGYAVDGIAKCFEESADTIEQLAEELKQFKDKQEQGLLIELPCKVGDTVYELLITGIENHVPVYEIYEAKVIRFIRDSFYWCCETITKDRYELKYEFVVDTFGKCVFLTRSEAEEALAKMGGK